ncbi:hypothetical protein ACFXGC_36715, partial [Streptomyces olivaceus]
ELMWADPLAAVIAYLTPILDPVRVLSRIPQDSAPRPPLLQVRRVGGTAEPPVREILRLDVFAWHTSDPQAMELALAARDALWQLPGQQLGGLRAYWVAEFMGPRQADDPASLTPRVWATYELTIRADQAIHASA